MIFDQFGNRKYLTASERKEFLNTVMQMPLETQLFCLTLVFTGARISEVLAITPSRIDIGNQTIILECLKKRRQGVYRAVPVPGNLIELLQGSFKISDLTSDPNLRDERLWPWCRTTAYMKVKDVMREAGVPEAVSMPKALRHTFGVHGVVSAKIPLNVMQKWMGHSRIETTSIYTNAVGDEERALASRMWSA